MKEPGMQNAGERRARRPPWRMALEIPMWLGAALLLLTQIACASYEVTIVTPENTHLKNVSFTPDFVAQNASRPAQVRYWLAPNRSVAVTWTELYLGSGCNQCRRSSCNEDRPINYPFVLVRHRAALDAEYVEDARFSALGGCTGEPEGPPALFAPTATGEYLAFIFFADQNMPEQALFPSEPNTPFPMKVLSSPFVMPPRLMMAVGDNAWEWRGLRGTSVDVVKEGFDPRLRVGKIRVLVGTCSRRGDEPRTDECGNDDLMDPAFSSTRIAPAHYIRVRNELVSLQDCRGERGSEDGNINLGPNPSDPATSLCRPQFHLVQLTPNYSSQETAASATLTWRVEFSADDGFPPPDPGEQVWIEFTLEPGP
jgi:hypothetical protein